MKKSLIWKRSVLGTAVFIWMGVIFLFSAQDGDTSQGLSDGIAQLIAGVIHPDYKNLPPGESAVFLETVQFFIRKTAHFLEYALLGLLIAWLLATFPRLKRWTMLMAPAICAAYATLDEFHQFYVGGRDASLRDVAIDSAGALFGAVLFTCAAGLVSKRRQRAAEIGGQDRG